MRGQQNEVRAKQLTALREKLAETAKVQSDQGKRLQQLSRIVQDAGWQFFAGVVFGVGQNIAGSHDVTIYSSTVSYSSQWPQ